MVNADKDIEDLLTTSGAARLANVSEGAIRNWCKHGKLPYLTLSNSGEGMKLFRRDDVETAAARYHAARA